MFVILYSIYYLTGVLSYGVRTEDMTKYLFGIILCKRSINTNYEWITNKNNYFEVRFLSVLLIFSSFSPITEQILPNTA